MKKLMWITFWLGFVLGAVRTGLQLFFETEENKAVKRLIQKYNDAEIRRYNEYDA